MPRTGGLGSVKITPLWSGRISFGILETIEEGLTPEERQMIADKFSKMVSSALKDVDISTIMSKHKLPIWAAKYSASGKLVEPKTDGKGSKK